MKKYLIGFGLAVIFFAGNGQAEWEPSFHDALDYKTCSSKGNDKKGKDRMGDGIWINTFDEKKDKQCLTEEVCNNLDFDITRKGTKEGGEKEGVAVRPENGKYVISDTKNIVCDENGECLMEGYDIDFNCYKRNN